MSATSEKCVCNDISHVSMRKGNKNLPRTSTCEDFLASTIAISGVRCYTVNTHNIVFADSVEVCSGTVILGLVLSQFFRTKRQGNRPQHLIHVQLTDQMSLYNHQGCRPRFLNVFVS